MLSIFAVLATLSAAVLLVSYLIRHSKLPVNTDPVRELPPVNARPLFAPTDEELRAELKTVEMVKHAEAQAEADAGRRRAEDQKLAEINKKLSAFALAPTRQDAISLIAAAADHGEAAEYSRIASEIIRIFGEGGLNGLTHSDLAALLDSHYRLLPAMARSSGELFWLKKEIAALRSKIVDNRG